MKRTVVITGGAGFIGSEVVRQFIRETDFTVDHLVRAWHHTYGLPVITTNYSNNYGPYQNQEKLIPLVIFNAVAGKPVSIYGNGEQIRDWLYVEEHVRALRLVIEKGEPGEVYNIGGYEEKTNLEVVKRICTHLDEIVPNHPASIDKYEELITFVPDRPGHGQRYAIDATKIQRKLGWIPRENFESGIEKTIHWYLLNQAWYELGKEIVYRGECPDTLLVKSTVTPLQQRMSSDCSLDMAKAS